MSEEPGPAFAVWCGLDVGKQDHHACALDAGGKRLFDAPLPQDQKRLEELFSELTAHGPVLVIVDQSNTIGALATRWPDRWISKWPTCPGWRCGGSLIFTPARPRPTPETPTCDR